MDPHNLSEQDVLTLTLIGEARGEPIEGQVAVGCIIRNRLHANPIKYKSYIDVCLERAQFSCWNMGDVNRALLNDLALQMVAGQQVIDPYFRQCALVAQGIINWAIIDNTHSAQNYLTTKLWNDKRPNWAMQAKNINQIGNQTFFTV